MSTPLQNWVQENREGFSGQILLNEPLSKHTYFRIGGPCSALAIPKSIDDLEWLREGIRTTGTPLFILGQGSNLLVSDAGFPGLVVRASRLNLEIGIDDSGTILRTGGSVAISTLLRRVSQEGWGGLEFLSGIPGSIGGVVRMNAGTHLGEAANALRKVEVFPLLDPSPDAPAMKTYSQSSFQFQYRKNLFLSEGEVVWQAEWNIKKEEPVAISQMIQETLARRKATQPIDYPSCGSVFKNPKGSIPSAWQVIDRLGLRGHRIGDAQFSEKHSNFIVNHGKARAADVFELIRLAKSRAAQELGVTLDEEVVYLGF